MTYYFGEVQHPNATLAEITDKLTEEQQQTIFESLPEIMGYGDFHQHVTTKGIRDQDILQRIQTGKLYHYSEYIKQEQAEGVVEKIFEILPQLENGLDQLTRMYDADINSSPYFEQYRVALLKCVRQLLSQETLEGSDDFRGVSGKKEFIKLIYENLSERERIDAFSKKIVADHEFSAGYSYHNNYETYLSYSPLTDRVFDRVDLGRNEEHRTLFLERLKNFAETDLEYAMKAIPSEFLVQMLEEYDFEENTMEMMLRNIEPKRIPEVFANSKISPKLNSEQKMLLISWITPLEVTKMINDGNIDALSEREAFYLLSKARELDKGIVNLLGTKLGMSRDEMRDCFTEFVGGVEYLRNDEFRPEMGREHDFPKILKTLNAFSYDEVISLLQDKSIVEKLQITNQDMIYIFNSIISPKMSSEDLEVLMSSEEMQNKHKINVKSLDAHVVYYNEYKLEDEKIKGKESIDNLVYFSKRIDEIVKLYEGMSDVDEITEEQRNKIMRSISRTIDCKYYVSDIDKLIGGYLLYQEGMFYKTRLAEEAARMFEISRTTDNSTLYANDLSKLIELSRRTLGEGEVLEEVKIKALESIVKGIERTGDKGKLTELIELYKEISGEAEIPIEVKGKTMESISKGIDDSEGLANLKGLMSYCKELSGDGDIPEEIIAKALEGITRELEISSSQYGVNRLITYYREVTAENELPEEVKIKALRGLERAIENESSNSIISLCDYYKELTGENELPEEVKIKALRGTERAIENESSDSIISLSDYYKGLSGEDEFPEGVKDKVMKGLERAAENTSYEAQMLDLVKYYKNLSDTDELPEEMESKAQKVLVGVFNAPWQNGIMYFYDNYKKISGVIEIPKEDKDKILKVIIETVLQKDMPKDSELSLELKNSILKNLIERIEKSQNAKSTVEAVRTISLYKKVSGENGLTEEVRNRVLENIERIIELQHSEEEIEEIVSSYKEISDEDEMPDELKNKAEHKIIDVLVRRHIESDETRERVKRTCYIWEKRYKKCKEHSNSKRS